VSCSVGLGGASLPSPRVALAQPSDSPKAHETGELAWTLSWNAPSECGGTAAFRRQVTELVQSRAIRVDELNVGVDVQRLAATDYRLSLRIETSDGTGNRVLQSAGCEDLLRAAAAIIAFSLTEGGSPDDSVDTDTQNATTTTEGNRAVAGTGSWTAATGTQNEAPDEADSQTTDGPPTQPSETADSSTEDEKNPADDERSDEAVEDDARRDDDPNDTEESDGREPDEPDETPGTDPTDARPSVWYAVVGSKFDSGLLPAGAVAVRLGGGWGDPHGLQLTLTTAFGLSTSARKDLPDSRDFQRYSLEAQLSYWWQPMSRVALGMLAALDVALVTASSRGSESAATTTASGGALGGIAELRVSDRISFRPAVELLVAARRAEFDFWEGTAHNPLWVAPRFGARAGLALITTF